MCLLTNDISKVNKYKYKYNQTIVSKEEDKISTTATATESVRETAPPQTETTPAVTPATIVGQPAAAISAAPVPSQTVQHLTSDLPMPADHPPAKQQRCTSPLRRSLPPRPAPPCFTTTCIHRQIPHYSDFDIAPKDPAKAYLPAYIRSPACGWILLKGTTFKYHHEIWWNYVDSRYKLTLRNPSSTKPGTLHTSAGSTRRCHSTKTSRSKALHSFLLALLGLHSS